MSTDLGEVSERGDEFRVLVYDCVLDVEVEQLPGGVEQHWDHDASHQSQAQALLRGGPGDHVPAQQVTRQGLKQMSYGTTQSTYDKVKEMAGLCLSNIDHRK